MKLAPVFGKPAAVYEEESALIIADLHIGIEREWMRGISRRFVERVKNEILELLRLSEAEKLIILGDLKHTIESPRGGERRVIRDLLDELSSKAEVILLKGNHDGDIEDVSPSSVKIFDSRGVKLGDLGLVHGHAIPREEVLESEKILLAHVHPVIHFRERSGAGISERVWVKGRGSKEFLIVPSFNPICGGINVEEISDEHSPVIKAIGGMKEFDVYLLDGIKVRSVRQENGV